MNQGIATMKKSKRPQAVSEQSIAPEAYRPIESLIPSYWREEWVVANGIRQHLYRTGSRRRPLVLFHGIMECGLSWLRLAKALEAQYEVIMPDARAYGRSDSPDAGLTPALLAEDAAGLILHYLTAHLQFAQHDQAIEVFQVGRGIATKERTHPFQIYLTRQPQHAGDVAQVDCAAGVDLHEH
jgi:hypothetical protein